MVPGIALLMALAAAPVVHGCAVRNMHTNRGPLACLGFPEANHFGEHQLFLARALEDALLREKEVALRQRGASCCSPDSPG